MRRSSTPTRNLTTAARGRFAHACRALTPHHAGKEAARKVTSALQYVSEAYIYAQAVSSHSPAAETPRRDPVPIAAWLLLLLREGESYGRALFARLSQRGVGVESA